MDAHTLPTHVSQSCSTHAHKRCPKIGCGCCCHLPCARCGHQGDADYEASQVIGITVLVCAGCFVILMNEKTHHVCVDCGDPGAYQEPAVSRQYRCVSCHQKHEKVPTTRWAS